MAQRTFRAYRELYDGARWAPRARAGALRQRLLWASTGMKDPQARDTLYVEALAAADTIDTMPEKTLRALADHGAIKGTLSGVSGEEEAVIADCARSGVAADALAVQLQRDGAAAFTHSWQALLERIAAKSTALGAA
jgi:transaldolase